MGDWAEDWAVEYWEVSLDGEMHELFDNAERRVYIDALASSLRKSFMPIDSSLYIGAKGDT